MDNRPCKSRFPERGNLSFRFALLAHYWHFS